MTRGRERAVELRLLDELLAEFPAASALELDPEGDRVLEHTRARIARVCRVPADPDRTDAARPGERFDLVTALGLLTASPGQREVVLTWARQRLRHNGRLVVSARSHGAEHPDTSRWIPRYRDARLGPEEAEDLLADAGFVLVDVTSTTGGRRWSPAPAGFLVIATPGPLPSARSA